MNPQQTIVGIYAEKSNEDWSSEFVLNDGLKKRRTLESGLSGISLDEDFDDLDIIEHDLDYSKASPVTLGTQKAVTSIGVISPTAVLEEEASEENEVEEDWDNELGIHDEIKESQDLLVDGFRFIMGQTLNDDIDWLDVEFAPSAVGGYREDGTSPSYVPLTIPPRCKIVSQLLHGAEEINLVLYPKSIALYSLKLDHDRRQLMAVELNDWLQSMVKKHKSKVENAIRSKDLNWLNRVQNQEKVFNLKLVSAWNEAISLLWRNKSLHIWDVLFKFSKLLRHFSRIETSGDDSRIRSSSTAKLSGSDKEQLMLHLSEILRTAALVDVSEAVTGQYTKDGVNRPNLHFKFVINQQFSGGVKNKPNSSLTSRTPALFHELLKSVIILLPEFMEEFALLEIQAAAHHCISMVQHQTEGVGWTPSFFTIFKCYIVLFRVVTSAEHSFTKKSRKLDRQSSRSETDDLLLRLETMKIAIICDLFYLLNAYSPLDITLCPHLIPLIDELKYSEGDSHINDDESEIEGDRAEANVKFAVSNANIDRTQSRSVLPLPGDFSREEKNRTPHEIDFRVTKILEGLQTNAPNEFFSTPSSPEYQKLTRSNLSFLQSQPSSVDFLASPDQRKRSVKQILEILSDKKVEYFDLFYLLSAANNACFFDLLTAKYRNVSRKHLLKPKISFALCLLNTIRSSSGILTLDSSTPSYEIIESLFLETLVLLDNLSTIKFNDVSPPIISAFGILVMEKFAERLVKDLKHKFALSCLESALFAHQLVKSGEDKRIYRYLTTVAHEGGDFGKRLFYQSRVLKITKDEGKLNEFVYIANLLSKLYTEAGEFQCAERCLRIISLIHLGCPLASVEFEIVDHTLLEYNILPHGVELPTINFRSFQLNSSSNSPPGVGLWSKRLTSARLVCDSQQVTSILQLIDLLIFSNRYHDAIDLSLSLLKRKIYPQGRATVLLTLAKCYLKLRLLPHCESTLDRIAYEADEIVSTTLYKPGYQNSDHAGTTSTKSSTMSAPVTSKFPIARFNRSMKDIGKDSVGIKKSPEARLSRPERQSSPRTASTTSIPSAAHTKSPSASASTVGFIARACSFTYMILRARCRLAADDPEWALHWLQIALALCPKGKWDRRCQVRYLMGRSYAKLCLRCRCDKSWGAGDLTNTRQLVELESVYATKAEEEFRHALTLSKTHTEDINKQTKAINRIIELHNSRLFHDVIVSKIPIAEALDGKAEAILRTIDGLCRISLQLSGDTCSPLELLRTLINASELSWLQGNTHQAFSAWCEAKTLMTITYLQPFSTMSWGPTASKASDTESRVSFVAGTTDISQFLPDPKNPLGDIPLPTVAYPPGLLIRLFDLLTRIVRLAFYITPCPLSNNGGALIASWGRMNHAVNIAIEPLYSKSPGSTNRRLNSFSKLFSATDTNSDRMFFPETYFSSACSTILGIYGLDCNPEKLKLVQKSESDRKRWAEMISTVDIPLEKIDSNLSRPMIPRGSRRLKSVNFSELDPSIVGLTQELEEIAIRDIIHTLCAPRDTSVEHKTDVVDDDINLDRSKLELVTATAHILSPFEMLRRALVLEFDLGSPFSEAIRTTEIVVKSIRKHAKNALFSPEGNTAEIIKKRSSAPSLSMNSEGYLVHMNSDTSDLLDVSPEDGPSNVDDKFKHEDLTTLLQKINNIYDNRIEPPERFEEYVPTMNSSASDVDPVFFDEGLNEKVVAYNSLLGCPQSKARMQVLFMRLRVYARQYTEGQLSLTDYHKKNLATIKKIVHSQSVGLRSHSDTELPSSPDIIRVGEYLNRPELDEEDDAEAPYPPERGRSHSAEIIQALATSSSISSCYPQSFRFVLYLDHSLMLFTPHTDTTAVVVLRGNVKMLHKAYSQMREDEDGPAPIPPVRADSSEFEFINPQLTQIDPSTSKEPIRRPSMARRHSSSEVPSRPSNNRVSTSSPGYNTLPFRKPPKPVSNMTDLPLTPPQVLAWIPTDGRLISALSDLPLALEDLYLDSVAFGSNLSRDDESMYQLFRLLGYQNIIFIWTALLLEESVLVVGNPGSEQQLAHVTTALLRLLRPLGWQHLYIPLMHSSMYPIFLAVLRNHEPFFISTYRDVVKDLVTSEFSSEPFTDFISGSFQHTLLSTRSTLSDITVVDIETGKVTPGRKLYFVAACTLSSQHGISPESDPQLLRHLIESLQTMDSVFGAPTFKPALPARYRLPIFLRLRAALTPPEMIAIYPPRQNQTQNFGDTIPAEVLRVLAREIAECMFNVSISLFKGLYYCVTQIDTLTSLGSRQNLHRREYSGGSGRYPLQEERFLLFLKDDVRPFVLSLLHTRSFKKLVMDIHHYKKYRPLPYHGGIIDEADVSPTLARFMTAIEERLEKRLLFFTTISTQRIGGYLTTFFTDISLSLQEEQLFQFLYIFPYSPESVKKYLHQHKIIHPHHKSPYDQIKIKRRWCVLDAQRLTYFKSRSTTQIKDYINIEPSSVRLVTSPYCAPYLTTGNSSSSSSLTSSPLPIHQQYSTSVTSQTCEGHNCALVYNGLVMVFRADTVGEHYLWVRALRSRLLPDLTINIAALPPPPDP